MEAGLRARALEGRVKALEGRVKALKRAKKRMEKKNKAQAATIRKVSEENQ